MHDPSSTPQAADRPKAVHASAARPKSLLAVAVLLVLGVSAPLVARAESPWITHPAAPKADVEAAPIALQFRREVTLKAAPKTALVRVSADNRFVLFVNGRRVGAGPARGDLKHWRYERFDLAPYLKPGLNVLAARVWNDASMAPLAQVSARTGFSMTPETSALTWASTGPAWRVRRDESRTVAPGMAQVQAAVGRTFYAAGPPETLDGAKADWSWTATRSTATDWVAASPALAPGEASPWTLVSDALPHMAYTPAPIGRLARAEGAGQTTFPNAPLTVPANSEAVLLLDAGKVEAAYPALTVTGGQGARITLTYAEALYAADKTRLSDRAQVEGGQALGLSDTILPDGGAQRLYQPYWWRVWRFLEVRVKTGAQPLTLNKAERFRTGYPFQTKARFASSDPALDQIWRIGWDTARVDAHETYQDSSYWEQLQYIGDTRLQALITYAVTGDTRLPVQAIDAIEHSTLNGLPRSAYPSRSDQSIPPFTLLWIGMLHDYWMHAPDTAPLKRNLAGMRGVLDWYGGYVGASGLIKHTPGWQFVDWRPGLSEMPQAGEPPRPDSCVISLSYVGALKQAAQLETALGDPARASADLAKAKAAAAAVRAQCWEAGRGLFANTPEKKAFSQHANALAVLYDVADAAQQAAILERVTVRGKGLEPPPGITGVSYYFAFYLARAFEHAGLGDRYLELLDTWRGMLGKNFTTWPESDDPSRSDTHAWSAHPTADLLTLVAGVQPAAPGFASVRVAPHLGALTKLDAAIAHPRGLIETRYVRDGDHLTATVTLPAGVEGVFEWRGRRMALKPGANRLDLTQAIAPAP
ncbi:hypothetical protein ASD89_02310 [Caulobacter sp. Root656]|nr:hypothetical protein ASD89_02310 [Caulobacter sp. Root656]